MNSVITFIDEGCQFTISEKVNEVVDYEHKILVTQEFGNKDMIGVCIICDVVNNLQYNIEYFSITLMRVLNNIFRGIHPVIEKYKNIQDVQQKKFQHKGKYVEIHLTEKGEFILYVSEKTKRQRMFLKLINI